LTEPAGKKEEPNTDNTVKIGSGTRRHLSKRKAIARPVSLYRNQSVTVL
jgi:hypothetical protein